MFIIDGLWPVVKALIPALVCLVSIFVGWLKMKVLDFLQSRFMVCLVLGFYSFVCFICLDCTVENFKWLLNAAYKELYRAYELSVKLPYFIFVVLPQLVILSVIIDYPSYFFKKILFPYLVRCSKDTLDLFLVICMVLRRSVDRRWDDMPEEFSTFYRLSYYKHLLKILPSRVVGFYLYFVVCENFLSPYAGYDVFYYTLECLKKALVLWLG